MGNLNFDASNIAPSTAFDPLPPGWYAMRITECEIKPSERAGDMVKLRFEIDETQHPDKANRSVFHNLCINHPTSQQAREIAQRSLSAICHAVGKLQVNDTDELLGQTLRVKLKAVPARTDQATGKSYDATNECTGFKSLSEDVDAPPAPASKPSTAQAQPAAAAASAKPSWKR